MFLEDLDPNFEVSLPEIKIEQERMLEFARLYDPIPLHLDAEYAEKTRFGSLIAPGVMSFMSVWAEFVKLGIFGEELIAGKSTKIEWFKPVYANDQLRGIARITGITKRNPYNGICEVSVDVYNQHGDLVLSDVTESVVRCRPIK